ncbi:hypothetical protein ONS95_007218 [Cadophora gregata]|uniref:uncharacterized protein n=1 Tax=Cadophora gregata TaxID=51156 RepID=UPI0026DA775D|nr:uncharacterized protein ONS95_007218 [Cadophora gregata]KAK0100769.1 hypothetical protein ONS95_007218 [Cadophora gregata]
MDKDEHKNKDLKERTALKQKKMMDLPLQYIHHSVKEFLVLDETISFFQRVIDNDLDPKLPLIWSMIQRIRIAKKVALTGFRTRLNSLVDSTLLLALSRLQEGKPSPVGLLDLLDSTMQLIQSDQEVSWVTSAIRHIAFCCHSRYIHDLEKAIIRIIPRQTLQLNENMFHDDFLSLAICYSITDYVQLKIAKHSLGIKKPGRPYLDYALARQPYGSIAECAITPRMVQILLQSGAEVNEHCPSQAPAHMSGLSDLIRASYWASWTPWKSALSTVSEPPFHYHDLTMFGHNQDAEQRRNWLEVFQLLLANEPDVGVKCWVMDPDDRSLRRTFTVSEIIANAFGNQHPKDTANLIARVETLAHAQKCPVYQQRLAGEVMETLRRTLVPHLEMTPAQEAYWGSDDKELL